MQTQLIKKKVLFLRNQTRNYRPTAHAPTFIRVFSACSTWFYWSLLYDSLTYSLITVCNKKTEDPLNSTIAPFTFNQPPIVKEFLPRILHSRFTGEHTVVTSFIAHKNKKKLNHPFSLVFQSNVNEHNYTILTNSGWVYSKNLDIINSIRKSSINS